MAIIRKALPGEFPELVVLWEASVRATHDFITDADIAFFKPKILNDYLPALAVYVFENSEGVITGYSGVGENRVEMLFVHPDARGQGVGKSLLAAAVDKGANELDVNEQNPQAVGFYQHMGFEVFSRSPLDGMGKPFPILHMIRK